MLIPEACATFSIFNPKQSCLFVFCFKNGSSRKFMKPNNFEAILLVLSYSYIETTFSKHILQQKCTTCTGWFTCAYTSSGLFKRAFSDYTILLFIWLRGIVLILSVLVADRSRLYIFKTCPLAVILIKLHSITMTFNTQ